VEETTLQLAAGLKGGCEPRKYIDRALKEADNTYVWLPNGRGHCKHDLRVKTLVGAEGAMTP